MKIKEIKSITDLDRIKRSNLINSITGINSANLVGTISNDMKDKMFNVFSTGKDVSSHNGLGLNVAQKIIYDYNGEIQFSQEGNWKDFTIKIPLKNKN